MARVPQTVRPHSTCPKAQHLRFSDACLISWCCGLAVQAPLTSWRHLSCTSCRHEEQIHGLALGIIVQVCIARSNSQSFMSSQFLDRYEIYLSHGEPRTKCMTIVVPPIIG